jgi:hypothetical protein
MDFEALLTQVIWNTRTLARAPGPALFLLPLETDTLEVFVLPAGHSGVYPDANFLVNPKQEVRSDDRVWARYSRGAWEFWGDRQKAESIYISHVSYRMKLVAHDEIEADRED